MKFSIKSIVALTALVLFALSVQAQFRNVDKSNRGKKLEETFGKSDKFDWNRVFLGGQFGGGFANGGLQGVISPEVGYYLTESILIAGGPTWEFSRFKDNNNAVFDNSRFLGGHIFGGYNIFKGLFAHAEYEYLTYRRRTSDPSLNETINGINGLYTGAGLRLGNFVSAMILYNFLQDQNAGFDRYSNPFGLNIQNPIIRVSFGGNMGRFF